jgi:Peptidase S46
MIGSKTVTTKGVQMFERRVAMAVGLLGAAGSAFAGEGMWTFDNPPTKVLQDKFGFAPSPEWLDRIRLASVRFNDGGSGSFVSAEGLMITNHHVGLACIQNVSTAERDYVKDGFYAPTRGQEAPCPGYEVNVLMKVEDVTSRILGAVKPAMADKEAGEARKAATATIENECNARTGLRCDVVKLYQGGEYHLYHYKKYTEVRLVFAPEQGIAFFGGDPDNFTFPRHDLDISLFHAYENGQPVKPASYLKWSASGVSDGDLVFVSGHPGSTSRQDTMAELESERDVALPASLAWINARLSVLRAYSAKGPENDRRAKAVTFGLENAKKAFDGRLLALQDQEAMARKAGEEAALRARAAADPALSRSVGGAWAAIAAVRKKADARENESRYVGFSGSRLLGFAGQIVRLVAEVQKPNEVRLEGFTDSSLPSLKNRLYSKAPVFDDLEETTLTHQLEMAETALGRAHPFIQTALAGRPPEEVAKALLSGTKLKDPAVRQALVEGGAAKVAASTDPMIAFARKIDPLARAIKKFYEDEVQAPITRSSEKIAQARWKVYGKTVSPDATFTLRLAYGTVKGYPAEGTEVPSRTTFYGLFDRSFSHGGKVPWDLPARWLGKRADLDLATPLNFVSTNDIIGGNSGSPVVNHDGELVGVIFDGNIQSLGWDYFYTEEQGRAVSVDARGIMEALRKVFEADALVKEILGS